MTIIDADLKKEKYRTMENKIVIIYKEEHTRGVDFRLSDELKASENYDPTRGIDLCRIATLPNPRAFI